MPKTNPGIFLFVTGDITQKGYEKKRTRLLSPYVPKQNASKLYLYSLPVYIFVSPVVVG